ncbi:response regulator [Luteolibacter sp. AS25]|uniref:response regulator n=1 Tax=Luteolibacter sp. AS25 TaxID=3135776 RepID=UPI00398A8B56
MNETDQTARILIVDDNRAIHEDFRKILSLDVRSSSFDREEADFFGSEQPPAEGSPFDLSFASQGQEALELVEDSIAKERPFSVAFIDIRMPPGWDGIETSQKLWDADPDLQIVICTAYSDYSWEKIIGKLSRADQFLILKKPFDTIEVRQCAHALASKWRLFRKNQARTDSLESLVRIRTAELIEARDTALESVRLKSRFLANMSHEIRTPMNGIIGMVDILTHTALNREQTDHIHTIRESAEMLLNIINDVLDSSKIDAGKLAIETQRFDVHKLVEGTIDVISSTAQKKKLEISFYIAPNISPYLKGDAGRLRQVLTNILGNAVKFTNSGDVSLYVTNVSENEDTSKLRFEIKDTGIGIAEDSLHEIFEPFCQGDDSDSRNYGGTGLGLSISRQIIETMGGEIMVMSEPGIGSTFWFEILFEKQKEMIRIRPEHSGELAGRKILLVGESAPTREILELQLGNLGAQARSVSGGKQAVGILRQAADQDEPYDLAILDLKLAGITGLELAGMISSSPRFKKTSILLLVPFGTQIPEKELRDGGIGGTITKPVKADRLFEGIRSILYSDPLSGEEPTAEPSSKHHPTEKLSILLAEDNLINQKVAKLQLRELGYEADVANNGLEVLDALGERHYDIILMDCQMPKLDGYVATSEIRQHYDQPIRIIGISANAMAEDRQKCLDAGMDDYISKPASTHALEKLIHGSSASSTPATPPSNPLFSSAIDFDLFSDITAGDPLLFEEFANDYIQQASEILNEMEVAIAFRSADEIRLLAHKLRGSSATCGMKGIIAPLDMLDKSAIQKALNHAKQFHDEAWNQLQIIYKLLNFRAKLNNLKITSPNRSPKA